MPRFPRRQDRVSPGRRSTAIKHTAAGPLLRPRRGDFDRPLGFLSLSSPPSVSVAGAAAPAWRCRKMHLSPLVQDFPNPLKNLHGGECHSLHSDPNLQFPFRWNLHGGFLSGDFERPFESTPLPPFVLSFPPPFAGDLDLAQFRESRSCSNEHSSPVEQLPCFAQALHTPCGTRVFGPVEMLLCLPPPFAPFETFAP